FPRTTCPGTSPAVPSLLSDRWGPSDRSSPADRSVLSCRWGRRGQWGQWGRWGRGDRGLLPRPWPRLHRSHLLLLPVLLRRWHQPDRVSPVTLPAPPGLDCPWLLALPGVRWIPAGLVVPAVQSPLAHRPSSSTRCR